MKISKILLTAAVASMVALPAVPALASEKISQEEHQALGTLPKLIVHEEAHEAEQILEDLVIRKHDEAGFKKQQPDKVGKCKKPRSRRWYRENPNWNKPEKFGPIPTIDEQIEAMESAIQRHEMQIFMLRREIYFLEHGVRIK